MSASAARVPPSLPFAGSAKNIMHAPAGPVLSVAPPVKTNRSPQAHAPASASNSNSRPQGPEMPSIIQHDKRDSRGNPITVRYQKGSLLGKGGFAKCYQVTEMDTGGEFACKVISKASLTKQRHKQKLQSEIKIHRSQSHVNIVRFESVFEDRDNVYIIMELCPHQTMLELVKKKRRLTEAETRKYMRQLLEGVKFMHSNNIIHRDLKLGNLFMGENDTVKIGDFGLACKLQFDGERKKTLCGTPNYIAPEVLESKNGHSFEVDTWSIGVVLFTCLVGKPPFETQDVKSTYKLIKSNTYSFPSHVFVPEAAKSLVRRILQSKPELRPSLDDILEDPWMCADGPHSATKLRDALTFSQKDTKTMYSGSQKALTSANQENTNTNVYSSTNTNACSVFERNITSSTSSTPATSMLSNANALAGHYQQGNTQVFNQRCQITEATKTLLDRPDSASSGYSASSGGRIRPFSATRPPSHESPRGPALPQSSHPSPPGRMPHPHVPKASHIAGVQEAKTSTVSDAKATSVGASRQVLRSSSTRSQSPARSATGSVASSTLNKAENKFDMAEVKAALPAAATSTHDTRALPLANTSPQSSGNSLVSQAPTHAQHDAEHAKTHTEPATSTYVHDKEDFGTLQTMHANFVNLFNGTISQMPTIESRGGALPLPNVWVSKWVDYSKKYGLGYTLNDGRYGVFFNDATKILLHPDHDNFTYIERMKASDGTKYDVPSRGCISARAPDMNKKVTLLEHFKNYLDENNTDKDDVQSCAPVPGPEEGASEDVYVRKWMRTRHSVIFRLSNNDFQVNFFDDTEVLVWADKRLITFKARKKPRTTYDLKTVTAHPEIAKRIKYVRDILAQLVNTQQ